MNNKSFFGTLGAFLFLVACVAFVLGDMRGYDRGVEHTTKQFRDFPPLNQAQSSRYKKLVDEVLELERQRDQLLANDVREKHKALLYKVQSHSVGLGD